ncbi:MAG: hypothetical protein ACLR6J_07725 [Parabacteroides merdae]
MEANATENISIDINPAANVCRQALIRFRSCDHNWFDHSTDIDWRWLSCWFLNIERQRLRGDC